ncbi:MAG: CinA family protein [Pseudomonadota bacterium]
MPVGTVYVASARQGRPSLVERHNFTGDRDTVRSAAVGAALAVLLRQLA